MSNIQIMNIRFFCIGVDSIKQNEKEFRMHETYSTCIVKAQCSIKPDEIV